MLIEQCVRQRDKEEVHVDQVEEARDHAEFVDAGTEPADPPGRPELRQRPRAAIVQLGQQRFDALVSLVILDVQIMDHQQVDARQAEALQAVLERAHHAVIAVVEPYLERQPAAPYPAIIGLGVMHRVHGAADLGGQHEVAARLAIKGAAEAVLALRQAVPRCGVVVADAGVPGGF